MNPTACSIDIYPNTIPTAPLALLPSLPTNAVSTRLYMLVTIILIIVGIASVPISFGIGFVVIFSY